MAFKYLKNTNSFDTITDPLLNNWSDYWYLNDKEYHTYTWMSDVFCNDELDKIVIYGKRLQPKRAETGDKGEKCLDDRRSLVSWITVNDHTKHIYSKLSDAVNYNNEKYFNFDLNMIERLQFTQYSAEELGCYHQHIDPLMWNVPHNRKLSFVMQLSHPDDYEGGELKLWTGKNPTIIEKQRGMIVFFPSYILHEVTPVTKGTRYSYVSWTY